MMTDHQKDRCATIIHSHAVAAAAGNAVPIPGLGIACDTAALCSMVMALGAVFKADITEKAAKAMSYAAIKHTALKQPIKTITKELSKFVPILGQIVSPTLSVAMIEAAGWHIAEEMAREQAA